MKKNFRDFGDQSSEIVSWVEGCEHSWVGYISGVCCIRCGEMATEPGRVALFLRRGLDAESGED